MRYATTYLHFNGNCREAMSFYHNCLGGELQLSAYPDAAGQLSKGDDAKIMHSQIASNRTPLLMASDSSPQGPVSLGNNFSVAIECDSVGEIERLFAAIGEKGQVRLPLGDMPWGAKFGMLTDQFGIQWFFNCPLSG